MLNEIKERFDEDENDRDDVEWLIEQAEKIEVLQKEVDFFIKRQEVNKVITQELASLNDPIIVEILTKTRIIG